MSHPGNLYAHGHLRAALKARFPRQFDCQHIGQDWPDGWQGLVTQVCEQVHHSGLDIRWVQIKEKFAGLRMYRTRPIEAAAALARIDALIGDAQSQSERTCCKCSGPAQQIQMDSWWLTLCSACLPPVEIYRRLPPAQRDFEQD